MKPRAYRDQVIVRPREDLDQGWASNEGKILLPDSATTMGRGPTGYQEDASCICEVVSRGPKASEQLHLGDIVVFDLYGVSQAVFIDGEGYLVLPSRAVRARIFDVGLPTELVDPIEDWVLSKEDRPAFQKHMLGTILAPEDRYATGVATDNVDDSICRCVLERVVDTGPRVREIQPAELVGFSPTESCRFRRGNVWYRLTPEENVLFCVE